MITETDILQVIQLLKRALLVYNTQSAIDIHMTKIDPDGGQVSALDIGEYYNIADETINMIDKLQQEIKK